MSKIKQWFLYKYLPAYCKESLTEENEQLRKRVQELISEKKELESYIKGMQRGLRAVKKIQIVNRGD
ncbi:MAG: hypothetical protein E7547_02825 [Ruminococcaceae bacterium]|nr:hypothetical protein [Oscillospiraceae bacterium]